MKGDFTRDTFDRSKHFSRVLMQQGRVQIDADWNEQVSILLHHLRTLAADLIGSYAGPGEGFAIEPLPDDGGDPMPHNFLIRQGHYYVDGILCENERDVTFRSQPDYPLVEDVRLEDANHLVYLDVWERHISYLEDEDELGDEPSIREVALGGPDTATRSKVVWQVKVAKRDGGDCPDDTAWEALQNDWQAVNRGLLRARARAPEDTSDEDPCVTPPEARYRGTENQLYRVEIHRGNVGSPGAQATFKWSRENGSVIFPILEISGEIVTVEYLGKDDHLGLQVGDWVEIVDDGYILRGDCAPLLKVEKIDPDDNQVILSSEPTIDVDHDSFNHPLLRRWDHKRGDPTKGGLELDGEGAAIISEGKSGADENWLHLEDGVQIQFAKEGTSTNEYRTGDFWLIPARTATGDVEWPGTVEKPSALPPHGIKHHYAPLAIIDVDVNGQVSILEACRHELVPIWHIQDLSGVSQEDLNALEERIKVIMAKLEQTQDEVKEIKGVIQEYVQKLKEFEKDRGDILKQIEMGEKQRAALVERIDAVEKRLGGT